MQSSVSTQQKARLILEAPVLQENSRYYTNEPGQLSYNNPTQTVSVTPKQPVQIIPTHAHISISPHLLKDTQITIDAAYQHNVPIRHLGYALPFSSPRLFQGHQSDWVLMNVTEDPAYIYSRNRLIVPKTVLRDLKHYTSLGFDFDAVFIAHELPKGAMQVGERVPIEYILPPPPDTKVQRLAALDRITSSFMRQVYRASASAITGALLAPLLVGGVVLGAATGALGAVTGLDPILVGLRLDRSSPTPLPVASWYYLTHWIW